jgi:endonuclease YncB( thermonuclease family)
MMTVDEAKDLIEKSIMAGKQILMEYTNSRGETKNYKIATVTSTWGEYFNVVPETDDGNSRVKRFRYDRISKIDITNSNFQPNDNLIEKIRDGSLFSDVDNVVQRKGGIKGYPSSINFIDETNRRLTKEEASVLISKIDIPPLEGWVRGLVWHIEDGDTFDLLLETDPNFTYQTRLFGADAPESSENSPDFVLGLQAKVLVEDFFKNSRCCYVKNLGKEAYRRHLMQVLNADQKDLAIELLESGLAVPMMAYFEDVTTRDKYEAASKKAYGNKMGIWSIPEIHARYNNIISDDHALEIDLLGHIPEKKSAIDRYLQQTPKARIVRAALARKHQSDQSKKTAEEISGAITFGMNTTGYDLEALKSMCGRYLEEIQKYEQASSSPEAVKDCIMHIEVLLDELDLGEGEIKGNFSKGKNKLIYHHDPEDRWYQMCIPEIRFKSIKDAKYCGFKKRT